MGGVDLLDQFLSYYRIFIKSNKWTLRIIFHFVDVAVVQSWIEYKKDFDILKLPKTDFLSLLNFRMRLAKCLIYVKKTSNRKRGRPVTADETEEPDDVPQKRTKQEMRPLKEIRLDQTNHLLLHDQKKESGRCKFPSCTGKSHITCSKCKVHLCLNASKNCFFKFHSI